MRRFDAGLAADCAAPEHEPRARAFQLTKQAARRTLRPMNTAPKPKPKGAAPAPQAAREGARAGTDGKRLTPSQRLWGTADFSYLNGAAVPSDDIMAALRGWD